MVTQDPIGLHAARLRDIYEGGETYIWRLEALIYIYIYIPLLQAELGWRDTAMLQRKVNRQAGCDAQQMYGNDSAVAEGLRHAYSLDLQLYAHARMLFCRALAAAKRPSPSA